jgi:hypothetical protein
LKIKRKWLKKIILAILLLLFALLAAFAWFYYPALKPIKPGTEMSIKGGGLPPGCSCHSKNPRFVSMHQLFSVEDCKKCHRKEERLMGKKSSNMTSERKAALEKRIREEAICQQCHRGGKIIVDKKTEISGRLFCPQEQKIYKKSEAIKKGEKYFCPKHGIELVDVDEIAVKSAREPKNEYCVTCHLVNKGLQRKHQKIMAVSQVGSIKDCLKCHTSHSNCGGCHF